MSSDASPGEIQEYFYQAVFDGNPHDIREQLDHGAHINARSQSGHSAVGIAALAGYVQIIRTLHEYGADVSIPAFDGCTPLHIASEDGDMDVIKTLVELGANLNAVMSDGCTPLAVAARNGQTETIKFYYSLGAGMTKDGPSAPLSLAMKYGHEQTVLCIGDILSKWTSKCECCGALGCEQVRYCSDACQSDCTIRLTKKYMLTVAKRGKEARKKPVAQGRTPLDKTHLSMDRGVGGPEGQHSSSLARIDEEEPDYSNLEVIRITRIALGIVIVLYATYKCTDIASWVLPR